MNALQELIYQIATDEGVRAQLQTGDTPSWSGQGLSDEEQSALLSLRHILTFSPERLLKQLGDGSPDGLWDMFTEHLIVTQVRNG